MGDWQQEETMYGVFPQLLYSWGLEEQIGEEEGSLEVIIWGWQATEGMRVGVTYDCYLFLYFVNPRNITIQKINKSIKFQKYFFVRAMLVYFRNSHQEFPEYSTT